MGLRRKRSSREESAVQLLVRGCAALRGHAAHTWEVAGRVFHCPGIEERGALPRHPTDHVIGEVSPRPAYENE